MSTFWAKSINGKLNFDPPQEGVQKERPWNTLRLQKDLRENPDAKYKLERVTPESRDQRNFFEGALVPLVTFFQEDLDYRDRSDLLNVRDWLKLEFTPQIIVINKKPQKVPGSTKGKLNKDMIVERIVEWMEENYAIKREFVLDTKHYDHWKNAIWPTGEGPDNYIDYLLSLGRLRKP